MKSMFYSNVYLISFSPCSIKSTFEQTIAEGIKIDFLEHKIVSEGAAATSIMVVKEKLSTHIGKNIICLICGGNIDAQLFNKVLSSANT